MYVLLLAVILVLILIFMYRCYFDSAESFNIPKSPMSEYVPQNMSTNEFRKINKWDYPGYLNYEKFDNIYPGDRITVNCFDADYVGMSPACDFQGPYIWDTPLYNINDKNIDSDNPYADTK